MPDPGYTQTVWPTDVACPICGADAGEPCDTRLGWSHEQRSRDAQRAALEKEAPDA